MNDTREEIIDQLGKLLTLSNDAEEGYKEAADNVDDNELKTLFLKQSQQRAEFAQELDREIRALGGDTDNDTSLTADLHRAWINIKSAFTSNDDKTVVRECHRGDQEALNDYNKVLQETNLAASTRELLLRQKQSIDTANSTMARLAQAV
ncbi:ferritin-like domain-containing protein [Spirosoma spitsbergense]|uniref:ferritin-like domain-containing protein n=1 Tax=Spirosoma spitsbergense TaxID=431554 RepID=UPI000379740C|nr:PA2169 family four-helix-bundle protein [Spirosoma spitsbergense]